MEIKLLDKDTNINKLHLNFCKEIIMNNETYKLLESIFSNEIIYTNSEELGIVAYIRGVKITIDNIGNYWVKLKLKDDILNNINFSRGLRRYTSIIDDYSGYSSNE